MAEPGYIAIEGVIGVGKTSLTEALARRFNGQVILEPFEENPFLARFYEQPQSWAFQTQLFFLMQRAQQMQELRQNDMFAPVRVSDFLMDKDRLFAELTLDDEEYKLYDQVYSHLTLDVPAPELVIYLAGADPFAEDQLGGLALTKRGLERRDRTVLERCLEAGARVAVVLAGGGALGAYEAGVLHYVLDGLHRDTALAEPARFDLFCGTSVGRRASGGGVPATARVTLHPVLRGARS